MICKSCPVELTPENRQPQRLICRSCWREQKATAARELRAAKRAARVVEPVNDAAKQRKKTAFLDELLRNGGFVERAIKAVGTSRAFVNACYNEDENFARLWDTIIELGNEAIETEIYRRGVQGVDKPLSYQGRLTGHSVKEYSDNLLMFLAKARMPTKYRDLPQKGDQLSDEELNARLAKFLAKRTGKDTELATEAVN